MSRSAEIMREMAEAGMLNPTFKEELHPRNRLGKFTNVLGRLAKDDKGRQFKVEQIDTADKGKVRLSGRGGGAWRQTTVDGSSALGATKPAPKPISPGPAPSAFKAGTLETVSTIPKGGKSKVDPNPYRPKKGFSEREAPSREVGKVQKPWLKPAAGEGGEGVRQFFNKSDMDTFRDSKGFYLAPMGQYATPKDALAKRVSGFYKTPGEARRNSLNNVDTEQLPKLNINRRDVGGVDVEGWKFSPRGPSPSTWNRTAQRDDMVNTAGRRGDGRQPWNQAMPVRNNLSNEERRGIYKEELKKARGNLKPGPVGIDTGDPKDYRVTGGQLAYAKGRARKAALQRIDTITAAEDLVKQGRQPDLPGAKERMAAMDKRRYGKTAAWNQATGGRNDLANTPKKGAKGYLAEPINFGGVMMPRGEAIKQMQAEGTPQVLIDRWLQGNDAMQRRNFSTLSADPARSLADEWKDAKPSQSSNRLSNITDISNDGNDNVVDTIRRQLNTLAPEKMRGAMLVKMDDNTLRIKPKRTNRTVDVSYNRGLDLYDVKVTDMNPRSFEWKTREFPGVFAEDLPNLFNIKRDAPKTDAQTKAQDAAVKAALARPRNNLSTFDPSRPDGQRPGDYVWVDGQRMPRGERERTKDKAAGLNMTRANQKKGPSETMGSTRQPWNQAMPTRRNFNNVDAFPGGKAPTPIKGAKVLPPKENPDAQGAEGWVGMADAWGSMSKDEKKNLRRYLSGDRMKNPDERVRNLTGQRNNYASYDQMQTYANDWAQADNVPAGKSAADVTADKWLARLASKRAARAKAKGDTEKAAKETLAAKKWGKASTSARYNIVNSQTLKAMSPGQSQSFGQMVVTREIARPNKGDPDQQALVSFSVQKRGSNYVQGRLSAWQAAQIIS